MQICQKNTYLLLITKMIYSLSTECIGKYSWHITELTEQCSDPTDSDID